jgi:ribosome-associated protein
MKPERLARIAVTALEDIKARDIVVLNTTKLTTLFDRMIIASADSSRQTRALATHVVEKAEQAGAPVQGVEGEAAAEWILIDLGTVIVHVMQPAARHYYNLEELWGGSRPRRELQRIQPEPVSLP